MVGSVTKTIGRIEPLSTQPVEESERHYVEVHTRWARHRLRQLPEVTAYHTNRVLRQYDIRGGWAQRPSAWRFVILRFEGPRISFTPEDRATIARDHLNCLKNLRSCVVDEQVLLDQRSGQTAFEKYLFEYDRAPDTSREQADADLDALLRSLLDLADGAFGLRLVALNRVVAEAEALRADEPGQVPTGRLLDDTTKLAYLEIYFDQQEWGDDFFARDDVGATLRSGSFEVANGYHVHEACGMDRR